MQRIDLEIGKAATLLGYSEQSIAALAQGELLAYGGRDEGRTVSLQGLALFVGTSADTVGVRGFRRAIEDPQVWAHVFSGVPHADSPESAAGRTVRRALAIADIRHA